MSSDLTLTKIASKPRRVLLPLALVFIAAVAAGCAGLRGPYMTDRDKTLKGAGVGAIGGAAAAVLLGEREADEILVGAAIGAVAGAGVGAYMDLQEEKLARIPGTTVERLSDKSLLVRFQSNVLYPIDSAVIATSGRSTLDQVAEVLLEYPKTAVVIQGHTDSSGSESHNLELSERRAESVRNHLVGRGVGAARMTALGYGEGYPVASNDTESGRQLNRRTDILLKANVR